MSDVAEAVYHVEPPEPFWTEARRDHLVRRWTGPNRPTASQLALELATSKNAVLGKLNRLGLLENTGPRERTVSPVVQGLMALKPSQCRFPEGELDAPDFHFCGAEAIEGLPYCYPHFRVTHVPQSATDARSAAWSEIRRIKARQRLLDRLGLPQL